MNTTILNRLTAATAAALLAVTFASCANADGALDPETRKSILDAGQGAVRFVPNDNDPRGRHIVLEALSLQAVHRLVVRSAADHYVNGLTERARTSSPEPASDVHDDLSPTAGP